MYWILSGCDVTAMNVFTYSNACKCSILKLNWSEFISLIKLCFSRFLLQIALLMGHR